MRRFPATLVLALIVLLLLPHGGSAATLEPADAAAFRDSVGVNTHITYYSTAYGNWPRIVEKLDELGVDHLRDGVFANPTWGPWNERYYRAVELAAAHGKRFTLGMGAPTNWTAGTVDELVAITAGRLRGAVDALEAPNEYDIFGGTTQWPTLLRDYVGRVKAAIDAEPRLDGVPFVGPSFARNDSRAKAGSLADLVDLGNIHPYTGGNAPSASHLASERTLASVVSGDRPLVATEAGFHNALNATSGQAPVPEDVAATYTLRTLLEHFRAGVRRTFLYELTDQRPEPELANPEQHFGLLRHDLSEKPAFTALKNLLTVVGRPAPATELEPVEASVSGGDDVESLLLAAGDGTYRLVLWLDRSVWDRANHRPIGVAPQSVEVTLPADDATLTRPVESATPQPLAGEGRTFAVDVPADPVVITFERSDPPPHRPPASGAAPAPTDPVRTPIDFAFAPAAAAPPTDDAPVVPAGLGDIVATSLPAAPSLAKLRFAVCVPAGSRLRATVGRRTAGRVGVLGGVRIRRSGRCRVTLDLARLRSASTARLRVRVAHRRSGARRWSVAERALPRPL
jgi:hypothetical protein